MKTIKQQAQEVIEALPEDVTWLTLLEQLLAQSDREATVRGVLTDRPPGPGTLTH